MIVIVSSHDDEHARAVVARLRAIGAEYHLLDLSEFPERMQLAASYEGRNASLQLSDGEAVDFARVSAVWWRRPQPFTIAAAILRPSHRAFAYNECAEALGGLWATVATFWMNDPARHEIAARKLHQLNVARALGLRIPETLITNDPERARAFVTKPGSGRVIYKAFSATIAEWRETRVVRPEELGLLANVRHAPVIFQEYVDAVVDLRITVVGEHVFAAAIHSQETAYPVDFRIDMAAARIEPFELPETVTSQVLSFMRTLGLVYGAVDMRLTPAGEYVFLEVNPSGQWLFIEERTRQPIADAVAATLVTQGS